MGVDFYVYKNCGDTFPDCGDFVSCECGEHWCCYDCAEADGFEIDENDEEDTKSCNYCRQEDFDDSELLRYVLFILNKNRDELIQDYKANGFNNEE